MEKSGQLCWTTREEINSNIWQRSKPFRHNRHFILLLHQACTNPGRQIAWATKYCTVAPNIFGSSVWNSCHVTIPAPRILRWVLRFWKFVHPCITITFVCYWTWRFALRHLIGSDDGLPSQHLFCTAFQLGFQIQTQDLLIMKQGCQYTPQWVLRWGGFDCTMLHWFIPGAA